MVRCVRSSVGRTGEFTTSPYLRSCVGSSAAVAAGCDRCRRSRRLRRQQQGGWMLREDHSSSRHAAAHRLPSHQIVLSPRCAVSVSSTLAHFARTIARGGGCVVGIRLRRAVFTRVHLQRNLFACFRNLSFWVGFLRRGVAVVKWGTRFAPANAAHSARGIPKMEFSKLIANWLIPGRYDDDDDDEDGVCEAYARSGLAVLPPGDEICPLFPILRG